MHAFRICCARAQALVVLTLATTLALPTLPASAEETAPEPIVAASTITSVRPASGVVTGGLVVTLTGTNFTGASAVAIGDVPASAFTVASATKLSVVTPALPAGSHAVSVTTAAGTTTAAKFTVRTVEAEVLRLVNDARSSKRKCGSKTYKAVKALRADATLAKVAAAHSADMALKDYFSHTSKNGDSPFDRMKAAGYRYSSAGENIAAGYRSPASVVAAWLKSTGHCKNIMKKSYTELGVGYATGGTYGNYWTQDFGNPR